MPESTPLYTAAVHGDADAVADLLAAGADPDEESHDLGDGTPLCAAACWGHDDVIRELLAAGADADLAEHDLDPGEEEPRPGLTPLLWTTGKGHVTSTLLLLEAGADPNLASDGWTPLHRAITRGSLATVQLLLQFGADPDARDSDGRDALAAARSWDGIDVAEELQHQLEHLASAGDTIAVHRETSPDGTEVVSVELLRGDDVLSEISGETGHAAIAALLAAERGEG